MNGEEFQMFLGREKRNRRLRYGGIIFLFLFCFLTADIYAYLDAGTFSYVIQILLAFLVGITVSFRSVSTHIKKFFKSLFGKKEPDEERATIPEQSE